MRQLTLLAGALALVVGVSGCGGDKDEAAVKGHLECMEALNKEPDGVKDAETLNAAKSKLESLGKELEAAEAKLRPFLPIRPPNSPRNTAWKWRKRPQPSWRTGPA